MAEKLNEKQQVEYEKISKYLDIILLSPETVNLLKFDKDFQQLVEKDINIVSYFETNFDVQQPKAALFVQAFKVITSRDVETIIENKELSNEGTVSEIINYNDVFLMNLIGQNVYQIEATLKEKAASHEAKTEVKEETAEAKRVDETTQKTSQNNNEQTNDNNPYANNPFMYGMNMNMNAAGGGFSMSNVADQLIQQQASMILNRNIALGKVYAFKTKPKIIPILKWLTVAFICLLLILSIVAFGVIIAGNGKITYSPNVNGTTGGQKYPLVLMSPFPFQLLMVLLCAIMIIISMVRNHKNENSKYHYSWGWMIFYIAMILIVTFISSGINSALIFNFDNFLNILVNPNNGNLANGPVSISSLPNGLTDSAKYAYHLIIVWRALQFTIYALIVASVICLILGAVFNPKRDYKRLEELILAYSDDIRNGTISSDDFGGGNMFGGPFSRMFF